MSRQSYPRGPQAANLALRERAQGKDEEEKGMWSTLLDSVASGKRLPQKNLVVLGMLIPGPRNMVYVTVTHAL